MVAAANSKILLRVKKRQMDLKRNYCSIYGKKLKIPTRRTSENPLSCWQCMILNNSDP
jgi:hypothetical protein